MKFARISLAAAIAVGALSTASFAQPLEEAIKGVDVSGVLRYQYDDTRINNAGFTKGHNSTEAKHKWKAAIDFVTPETNNVALNLGVYYNNSNDTNKGGWITRKNEEGEIETNNGPTSVDTGSGLGAGSDGEFGVSTFFATFTPDDTKTIVNVGKMRLDTPITDAGDDRGTGIIALNSDLPNWTFAGVALDTWSLDDHHGDDKGTSVTEALLGLAAIANYGDLSAQVWYFTVKDAVKNLIFAELAYTYDFLNLKGQLGYSALDNGKGKLAAGDENNKNLLYTLEAGVDFDPVSARIGYVASGKNGYRVSFDNQGSFSMAGRNWNDGGTTVDYSVLGERDDSGVHDNRLKVLYAAVDFQATEELALGLEYVTGEDKAKSNFGQYKTEFTEIVPSVTYQYSEQLELSAYYSMLTSEFKVGNIKSQAKAKQNQFQFEALYKF